MNTQSPRSIFALADLSPAAAAMVADFWANDARYLVELSSAVDSAYAALQDSYDSWPMMLTRESYRESCWQAFKQAERAYADAINESCGTMARRIAYAYDWFKF